MSIPNGALPWSKPPTDPCPVCNDTRRVQIRVMRFHPAGTVYHFDCPTCAEHRSRFYTERHLDLLDRVRGQQNLIAALVFAVVVLAVVRDDNRWW